MPSAAFIKHSEILERTIDIAIESFKKFPPEGFDEHFLEHTINCHVEWKGCLLDREKPQTMTRISDIKSDVLIYFQEGTGDAVEYFWRRVTDENLGIKRENKLAKILKRGKIKNDIEYDFVIDVMVPYRQQGVISEGDVVKLNQLILAYERKK